MKSKVFIITNIAPLYRSLLWESLLKNKKYKFEFLFGKDKTLGIKEINFYDEKFNGFHDQLHTLKNIYFNNSILFWQQGLIKICLFSKIDTAIIIGDPWILSNWIVSIIFRLKRVKVVFWSHGIYGNETGLKKVIKRLFYSLANKHLLYERRGKEQMIASGFNEKRLHVVFNSLDYTEQLKYRLNSIGLDKKQLYPFFKNPLLPTIIFVGRLTKVKKLHYLLSSIQVLKKQNIEVNFLIIGTGDQKSGLTKLVSEYNINDQCFFFGPCYSEEQLSKLIAMADLCVSPGNVGLTAIHSLGYGTPVMTHNNFQNQMPEVGVIEDGINGVFFEENSVNSMVSKIKSWLFHNDLTRIEIRKNCYDIIDKYYNPNFQLKVIANLLENKPPLV